MGLEVEVVGVVGGAVVVVEGEEEEEEEELEERERKGREEGRVSLLISWSSGEGRRGSG